VAALAAAVAIFPAVVLLVAPLLLGLPHVLAELRLFARRLQITVWQVVAIASPLAAIIILRVVEVCGYERPANSDVALGCVAICVAAALRAGRVQERIARASTALGASIIALHDPQLTTLALAHAHNFVALAFLLLWKPPGFAAQRAQTIIVSTAIALLLLVVLTPLADAGFVRDIRLALAPALDPEWGLRLVLVYAFAQLLHYAVWLWWLPTSARGVTESRPAVSGNKLALIAGSIAALPIVAWLAGNPVDVRNTYLALSGFHGWLELSVLAFVGLRSHAH
jgi:hypothetical protein